MWLVFLLNLNKLEFAGSIEINQLLLNDPTFDEPGEFRSIYCQWKNLSYRK